MALADLGPTVADLSSRFANMEARITPALSLAASLPPVFSYGMQGVWHDNPILAGRVTNQATSDPSDSHAGFFVAAALLHLDIAGGAGVYHGECPAKPRHDSNL